MALEGPQSSSAGHRCLPHPADVILQAWGSTPESCLQEAVKALVDSFADTSQARPVGTHAVHIPDADWADLLVAALEEVIYLLDVSGEVPLDVRIGRAPGDGLSLTLDTVPVEDVELVGSTPKGIARSGLEFGQVEGQWWSSVIVDV